MALVYGPLSEGVGRRPVLIAGTVGFGMTSVLCAVSSSFDVFLLGRIGQGACAGAGAVVARAVITDKFQDRDAQRAMAMYMTVFAIGPAVAPIIGAAVLRQFGWRTIFWMFAALAVVLSAVAGARIDSAVAQLIDRRRQVTCSLGTMVAVAATNVALSALLAPGVVWSLLFVAALAFCWGLLVPAATVLAFQAAPNAKGTASGVQLFTTNCSNLIVSAAVVPLVLRSLVGLAIGALALSILASLSWTVAWRPGHR